MSVSSVSSRSKETLSPAGHLVNGVASSTAMMGVVQPLDTVKTWLMSGNGWPPGSHYYRGFIPNLWGVVPSMGVAYATNGGMQKLFFSNRPPTTTEKFGCGLVSGVTGAVPAVLFSRWAVIQQIEGGSAWAIYQRMQREGIRTSMRGYLPTALRDSGVNGVLFGALPALQPYTRRYFRNCQVADGVTAFTAGAAAGASTAYLDQVKIKMQTDKGGRTFLATCLQLPKEVSAADMAKATAVRSVFVGVALLCLDITDKRIPSILPLFLHK